MSEHTNNTTPATPRKASTTGKLLGTVVVLQGLILMGQWTGQSVSAKPAKADVQISDPASRQLAMVEELKGLNAKMDKLLTLLQSGEVHVKATREEDKK